METCPTCFWPPKPNCHPCSDRPTELKDCSYTPRDTMPLYSSFTLYTSPTSLNHKHCPPPPLKKKLKYKVVGVGWGGLPLTFILVRWLHVPFSSGTYLQSHLEVQKCWSQSKTGNYVSIFLGTLSCSCILNIHYTNCYTFYICVRVSPWNCPLAQWRKCHWTEQSWIYCGKLPIHIL